MKSFSELFGTEVDRLMEKYREYEKRMHAEGGEIYRMWIGFTQGFLHKNFPKAKYSAKPVIATIQPGQSFEELEKFVESTEKTIEVAEIVYDPVRQTFTLYGKAK